MEPLDGGSLETGQQQTAVVVCHPRDDAHRSNRTNALRQAKRRGGCQSSALRRREASRRSLFLSDLRRSDPTEPGRRCAYCQCQPPPDGSVQAALRSHGRLCPVPHPDCHHLPVFDDERCAEEFSPTALRSEEHTSELQSPYVISYAV